LALDGVRGIAILLVMVYHFNLINEPATRAEKLWTGVVNTGWSGVDLFFVLSGFLITGILWDARHEEDTRSSLGRYFGHFYARRVLRIFPLYYLFLAVCFWLLPALVDVIGDGGGVTRNLPGERWWFWLYLPNVLFGLEGGFVGGRHLHGTWSLGIEEQFYLLWPLVVYWLSRRWLLGLTVAAAVGALAMRFWYASAGVHWITIFVMPWTRMDCLLFGAALALWMRGAKDPGGPTARLVSRVVLAVGLLLVVGYAVARGQLAQYHPLVHTLGFTLLAVGYTALVHMAVTAPGASLSRRVFENRGLRLFGRYAYGLYLIHVPVQHLVLGHILEVEGIYDALGGRLVVQWLFHGAGLVVSLALAALVYHAFEAPFLKLKRFFPR
jgi:peptidoglycan/LPS O-acetylase OafA/YrhL